MVKVFTSSPRMLLDKIKEAVAEDAARGWQKTDTGLFTHEISSDIWKQRAWFKAYPEDGLIRFNIIRPKGDSISKATYALYHGRFSEMLLRKFDHQISKIEVTALASKGDLV